MSHPVYTVPDGDTLPIFWGTYDGGTGASITMTGLAVTDVEIFKDGSATQRSSDAGITLLDTDGTDFDGITGIHGISIDLSDNTDAGFYTVGSWFHVVVSAVTVDAQTVSFVAAAFRIMAAEASAGVVDANIASMDDIDLSATMKASVNAEADTALTDYDPPTNAELNARTLASASYFDPAADTVANVTTVATTTTNTDMRGTDNAALASVVGALTDAAAAGDPTTTDTVMQYVKQLINVLVGTAGVVTFPTSAAPANAVSLAEVIRAIYDDTNEIQVDTNALNDTKIPDTISLAAINAEADTALTDYDPPTNAEMEARTLAAASYATAANQTAIETDTQDIQGRLPAALSGAGNILADMVAISGDATAADRLEAAADGVVTGAAATGTLSTTQMTTDLTEATDDHYIGRIITWTSGVLLGQSTDITDYSGTNGLLTFTAVTETPSDGDTFIIQ